MKQIFALDLGTKTGYAVNNFEGKLTAGTWTLACAKLITQWGKTRMTRRCDPRVTNLFKTMARTTPDIIVFEDVQFASSTYQVQLWASLRAAIWCAFARRDDILIECVPTGTLKKFATGHGNATKPMMAAALYKLWPELKSANLDDNARDALWLWYWADKHLTHGK